MSHTVLRGHPTASQLYLDTILDAIINEKKCRGNKKERGQVNLAEITYFCMKQKPDKIYMVNGSSGEEITNGDILKWAIPLAQAIRAKHVNNGIVMFLMRSHQHMAALYYGTLFAGVVPLMIDPNSTVCEIRFVLQLVNPYMVFCDEDRCDDVMAAANHDEDVKVIGANKENILKDFYKDHWNNSDNFQITQVSPKSTVLLIPTSGSSGMPKATVLAHSGLIAQLPIIWSHHSCFPRPTERVLLLSSPQWVTHSILMNSCPVYGVTLVMTPQKPTTDHILTIMERFHPTWSLFNPIFLKSLAESGTPEQFCSLKTAIVTGAPLTQNVVTIIKEKLSKSAHLGNGMGMTETHGFIAMPAPNNDWMSSGKIANTLLYKVLGEDGKEVGVNTKGELYIQSKYCIFWGYYKNEEAYRETVTQDGWYKTDDMVYKDESDGIYFVERKKFWFMYLHYRIVPEELERVISSVPGVQEVVVCDSEKGPAAAVVLKKDHFPGIEESIHRIINETFSDYKRLRGGIYFVSSVPRTHSGKIKRKECLDLIKKM